MDNCEVNCNSGTLTFLVLFHSLETLLRVLRCMEAFQIEFNAQIAVFVEIEFERWAMELEGISALRPHSCFLRVARRGAVTKVHRAD